MLQSIAVHGSVIAATLAALAACVLLQYEVLVLVYTRLARHRGSRRIKVVYAIFSVIARGDIAPVGPIRFLSATEALTGFVLITWSAPFTYLEMEKFWRAEEMEERKEV